MAMATVKNLIFDVGGVLIGYRWKEMFMDDFGLSEKNAEALAEIIFDDPMWNDFDRGIVNTDDLVDHYCDGHPDYASYIRRIFYENDKMATEREAVWKKIAQLKEKGYGIYILSNYSEYLFKKHTGHMPFGKLLDGGVVSYETGYIKPETGIYTHILEKYHLDPHECIFFDDMKANVEAAEKIGIRSRLITSEEDLLKELDLF